VTAVTNTRVLHLWSTRSSASRPLDRTTTARRTTNERPLDDDDDEDERGEPDSPLAPAFRTSRAPVHAPASTRSRSTKRRRRSVRTFVGKRNGTERDSSSERERRPLAALPRFEPRLRTREQNRTEQNRTDRSRYRSRPIVPTRTDERMDGCARARLN